MPQTRRRISSLDRFIPRRSSIDFEVAYLSATSNDLTASTKLNKFEDGYYINTAREAYLKENYRNALRRSIFSNKNKTVSENRILDFSNKHCNSKLSENCEERTQWPVEARTKPLIPRFPYIILDMPDLDSNFNKNIIDWGKTGYIATIYESQVHLWHPEKKIGIRVADYNENNFENCIKWNKDGKQFAMALRDSKVIIYDMVREKSINVCICPHAEKTSCQIMSVEWTKSNCLITGCTQGSILQFSSNLEKFKYYLKAHLSTITKLALSCNENYLASKEKNGAVLVWTYPVMKLVHTIECSYTSQGIDWHPWRDSLLVVSQTAYYEIWNIQNKKMSRSITFPNSYIHNISFNPVSAELLVSVHDFSDDQDQGITYLKVMKNLECVVDEIRCNQYEVPYLLWNHTGTKLGTASTEENFCVWDFFGRGTKQEKKYLKAEKKIMSMNLLQNVNFLGKTIR